MNWEEITTFDEMVEKMIEILKRDNVGTVGARFIKNNVNITIEVEDIE